MTMKIQPNRSSVLPAVESGLPAIRIIECNRLVTLVRVFRHARFAQLEVRLAEDA